MKGRKLKLQNLKSWLTLEDASKQLSILFGDDVEPKDILQLALDRHLRLSIYCRSVLAGRPWRPNRELDVSEQEYVFTYHEGCERDLYKFFCLKSEALDLGDIKFFQGLVDLPMLGAEVSEVERCFINNISQSDYRQPADDGFFVYSEQLGLLELFMSCKETANKQGETPYGMGREIMIEINGEEKEVAHLLRIMPQNSIFVVRPESIADFVNKAKSQELSVLAEDKEKTYLSIIAALLDLLLKEPKSNRTQGSIAQELEDKYKQFAKSFSVSTLTKLFPKAKEALENKTKEK